MWFAFTATNGEPVDVSGLAEETPAYLTQDKVQNAVSTHGAEWKEETAVKQRKPRNPPRHKVLLHL